MTFDWHYDCYYLCCILHSAAGFLSFVRPTSFILAQSSGKNVDHFLLRSAFHSTPLGLLTISKGATAPWLLLFSRYLRFAMKRTKVFAVFHILLRNYPDFNIALSHKQNPRVPRRLRSKGEWEVVEEGEGECGWGTTTMLLCAILISIIVDSGFLAWYLHLQVGYLCSAQLVSWLTTGTVNQLEEITFSA